jgi:hypothetical protein
MSLNIELIKLALAVAEPKIVIDRPKGFKKTFHTQSGKKEMTYPIDYGYFKGHINPEDKEGLDVFVGSGGPHYGKFMKGKFKDKQWAPDEHKYYHGLTHPEFKSLTDWYNNEHDPGLTRDWTTFKDKNELHADIAKYKKSGVKVANSGLNIDLIKLALEAVQPQMPQAPPVQPQAPIPQPQQPAPMKTTNTPSPVPIKPPQRAILARAALAQTKNPQPAK